MQIVKATGSAYFTFLSTSRISPKELIKRKVLRYAIESVRSSNDQIEKSLVELKAGFVKPSVLSEIIDVLAPFTLKSTLDDYVKDFKEHETPELIPFINEMKRLLFLMRDVVEVAKEKLEQENSFILSVDAMKRDWDSDEDADWDEI